MIPTYLFIAELADHRRHSWCDLARDLVMSDTSRHKNIPPQISHCPQKPRACHCRSRAREARGAALTSSAALKGTTLLSALSSLLARPPPGANISVP